MTPELVDTIRRALIHAAQAAYEDAGMQGLCAEGRWEAAVSAMRRADLAQAAREVEPAGSSPSTGTKENRPAGDRNGAVGVSGGPVHPHRP